MTYEQTTAGLMERNVRAAPDRIFVTFPGGSWTYRETLDRARSVANGLRDLGVAPGDYVASWLPNGPEALLALLGVNLAGAVQVPMNTAYRGGLLEHALNLSAARTLIVHHELVKHLASIEAPHLQTVIVVGGEQSSITDAPFDVVDWSQLETGDTSQLPIECRRSATDDMIVIFTSGTTGPSKGVRCSYVHHASYAEWFSVGDLGSEDRALIVLPLFHVGGTGWVFAALTWGASLALLPRFETRRFWQDVEELGATTCTMVGAMATFLLQEPRRDDDADTPLRIALATPWMEAWPEFAQRFGIKLWSGFGMSEVPGPLRSGFPDGDITGLGRATSPEWDIRVVDGRDLEVPDGTPGELIVRHRRPWVITHGYLNMPVQSGEAWRNGWFHTGDVVIRREDGSYAYVDRSKDSIRRRGENISSLEVEVELRAHPDVLDAAVVAVPSEHSDDEVMAFVQVKQGEQVDCAALIDFVLPRMPHYMVPRYVEVVTDLPRTPTGKLRKVELRERGVGSSTWDREQAGIRVKSERLSAVTRR
nr:AMP-binding protein [Rhodococcus wratislaviensis]GLK33183.1 ATP-dependent acyl-CoA ligase [Rhodococcus wratislaviensis]